MPRLISAVLFLLAAIAVAAPAQPVDETPDAFDSNAYATGDWFGLRADLLRRGIDVQASLTIDEAVGLKSGLMTNNEAFQHLFDLNITIDAETLLGLTGGTFYVDFMNHNGRNTSEKITGDWQWASNIETDGRTQIAELWYEQLLLDDKLRIKVGKIDANYEFALPDYAEEFVHSSPWMSPTILGMTTYPDPATGVVVFIHPCERFYAGVGVFDGATQEGFTTGSRGPSTFFGSPADLFIIGEAGVNWSLGEKQLPGRFRAGGWGHTGAFERFDGDVEHGTAGYYLILSQQLWRENPESDDDEQGIGAFAQFGWADDQISEIETHWSAGAQWIGPIPGRDDDVAGLMASYVSFTDEAGAGFSDEFELAVELFYKVQLTQWLSVKPDLQYIANPGGEGLSDAVVGILRIEVAF